jgi:hypothetical protein
MPVAKGGLVHQDDGRPLGRGRQRRVEPGEPLRAQQPAMLTWNVGVERHDAQGVFLDRVVEEPGAWRRERSFLRDLASSN